MRLIMDTQGKVYAVQLWRLVVYVDRVRGYPTWWGGCMVTFRGNRALARHVWWRLCWVFCS